jgi:anti-sigma-K factor RskA
MNCHFANWDEETLNLAIEHFTVGIGEREKALLDGRTNDADLEEFENAVSAIQLSSLVESEAPSKEFLGRLERVGRQQLEALASTPEPKSEKLAVLPQRMPAFAGWLVAAGLLLAFFLSRPADERDANTLRAELIADASDIIRIDWTAAENPASASASGDVVWSSSLQEGYMLFRSLAPNDPKQSQFQLWIFDPTRANWEDKPVDGGVFDISSEGEVVIPIDAKLLVSETALFAITIEVPGGVVVSEREQLILTAAL